MNDRSIRRHEQRRLQRTLDEINAQLHEVGALADNLKDDVIDVRGEMWVDLPKAIRDFDDAVNFIQHQQVLDQQERQYVMFRRLIPRLERLRASAYFGRIDFHATGDERPLEVYIGTASLVEQSTGTHLIYDWRAPIASMFYDFEPGPAHYKTTTDIIEGHVALKRQYKIEGDQIIHLFDTDVKIDDDILQAVLGRTVQPKMRTIVQSIQREQNRAIRDETHPLLIVSGPAGSGKTSIALHRIAYLLYRRRGTLNADDVVIISPNDVFGDYISRVLPDLGEDEIQPTTFLDCTRGDLEGIHVETAAEQFERVLTDDRRNGANVRSDSVRMKSSSAFLFAMRSYAEQRTSGSTIPFETITYRGQTVITREEILTLLRDTYQYLPYRNRLDKINRRIFFLLDPLVEARSEILRRRIIEDPDEPALSPREIARRVRAQTQREIQPIKEAVRRWTTYRPLHAYADLFRDPERLHRWLEEAHEAEAPLTETAQTDEAPSRWRLEQVRAVCRETRHRLEQRRLAYEDVAPYLCLRGYLGDVTAIRETKHVVIDEAQDYTPCHFKVFHFLFPNATFTVLGDPDQSIHPHTPATPLAAKATGMTSGASRQVALKTSYRSTEEITRFTQAMLRRDHEHVIERAGAKPRIIQVRDDTDRRRVLWEEVQQWQAAGLSFIAIITKTAAACRQARDAWAAATDDPGQQLHAQVQYITSPDDRLDGGVVMLPSYFAKGLEFDGVLVYDASASTYTHENERRLLYTVCTRALHRLTILSAGPPSPLFAPVDPGLYVQSPADAPAAIP